MTAEEWLKSEEPQDMLRFLDQCQSAWRRRVLRWIGWSKERPLSGRKLRLFACACCRSLPSLMEQPHLRKLVEISEAFGDNQASDEELQEALSTGVEIL